MYNRYPFYQVEIVKGYTTKKFIVVLEAFHFWDIRIGEAILMLQIVWADEIF